ncbi:hypothetical protein [Pseudomonas aeruginosa]|uniref:hypothetical protein n=1 Tax=Pseudomonas aeruginosa TaxID=287 RepID=UPI00383AF195
MITTRTASAERPEGTADLLAIVREAVAGAYNEWKMTSEAVTEIMEAHERIVGALRFERQQMDRAFTACINERDAAQARCAELKAELAMANDAAAKGDAARHQCAGMEMEIKELRGAADHWEAESRALQKQRDAALANVDALAAQVLKLGGTISFANHRPAQAQHSVPERLELTDDLKNILGRPNFTCTHLAQALRQIGFVIDRKAEAEQAACLHWMLNHYLASGANWKVHAEAELQAAAPGKEVGHE